MFFGLDNGYYVQSHNSSDLKMTFIVLWVYENCSQPQITELLSGLLPSFLSSGCLRLFWKVGPVWALLTSGKNTRNNGSDFHVCNPNISEAEVVVQLESRSCEILGNTKHSWWMGELNSRLDGTQNNIGYWKIWGLNNNNSKTEICLSVYLSIMRFLNVIIQRKFCI